MTLLRLHLKTALRTLATLGALSACFTNLALAQQTVSRTTITSPRDVDLAFVESRLVILAQLDGRFSTSVMAANGALSRSCVFGGRAAFTYDKKYVLSVKRGAVSTLTLQHPTTCAVRFETMLPHNVIDADATEAAERIMIASREAGALHLHLYDWQANRIATLGEVRNAELGFSPDGTHAINFDHSGRAPQIWRAEDGSEVASNLAADADLHFSGNGTRAFATRPGKVWEFLWPDAHALNTTELARNGVVRAASHTGNTLIVQEPNPLQTAWPVVHLYSLSKAKNVFSLGSGHIDATAIDASGTRAAIAIRAQNAHRITISLFEHQTLFEP